MSKVEKVFERETEKLRQFAGVTLQLEPYEKRMDSFEEKSKVDKKEMTDEFVRAIKAGAFRVNAGWSYSRLFFN